MTHWNRSRGAPVTCEKYPGESWGSERQKDQVAIVVCSLILGAVVWALIDLFFLR